MLMLLQSRQRGQTLHLLNVRNMFYTIESYLYIRSLLKTSGPRSHLSQITFKA